MKELFIFWYRSMHNFEFELTEEILEKHGIFCKDKENFFFKDYVIRKKYEKFRIEKLKPNI